MHAISHRNGTLKNQRVGRDEVRGGSREPHYLEAGQQ